MNTLKNGAAYCFPLGVLHPQYSKLETIPLNIYFYSRYSQEFKMTAVITCTAIKTILLTENTLKSKHGLKLVFPDEAQMRWLAYM